LSDPTRGCVFLVADGTMEQVVRGLLGRPDFSETFGIGAFDFELLVEREGNDPGVFRRGAEFLKPYSFTHQNALLMLDAAWEGAPKPRAIREKLRRRMEAVWPAERFEVVVLDPELEVWIWQDDPSVERVVGFNREHGVQSLRSRLEANGWWPARQTKPPDPKGALQWALRQTKIHFSSALHREVARHAPFHRCKDPAFKLLAQTLRRWYPIEGA